MKRKESKGDKKSHRTIWITITILILLLVVLPIGYVIYAVNRTNYDNSKDNEIIINDELLQNENSFDGRKGYTTFAIFGLDSRSNDLESNTRSDTIIIAHVNNQTKEVKLVSIYRDTYVEVPNHGYTKINHAYAYGGYSLALSTINTNFDLNISQYVSVNFYAVAKVIDLLGGITLDITDSELKWLNGYIKENNRVNGTNVSGLTHAGTQTVNGTQALAYARIRYTSGGDFKRTERQRIVVSKIFEKAKAADVTTLINIVTNMLPDISTNISATEILSYSKNLLKYQISDSSGFPFEKDVRRINGVSYVLPINLSQNVSELHRYMYGDENYIPTSIVQSRSDYIATQ